jgi:LuxR family maltose regulon positive regulatory protein
VTISDVPSPHNPSTTTSMVPDQVFEAKIHRPPTRPTWVRRDRLLDALDEVVRRPVTLVTAPAGYGKTTLLAQWLAEAEDLPTAWLSLDSGDNDPNRLWSHVAVALGRAGCALPAPAWQVGVEVGPTFARTLLPALVNALTAMPDDIVLVLDDFDCVREHACHEQVQHLIANLPPQAHLVLLTRSDPGLHLGRLRASGDLLELRAKDLGFTEEEATTLLGTNGVRLREASTSILVDRTEGWPAGLYLAALSMAGLDDPDAFVRSFSGGNRFVGDYLVEEVLDRQDDQVREFILMASVFDRFTASLCDHVRDTTDSAAILHDLARSNLFVVPLDDAHEWFRFHHLFAAVARSELEYAHPEVVQPLHSRAADWFQTHGLVDQAVDHLLAAGRRQEAARLVGAHWLSYLDAGRWGTVSGWLESLGPEVIRSSAPALVTAAWGAALTGDEPALTEHIACLSSMEESGPLPDGTRSIESAVALIEATFAYGGPLEAKDAAIHASEIETDERSPAHALAQAALGHAAYVLGDLELAVQSLRSATVAGDDTPGFVQVRSLSIRSLIEDERGNLAQARELAELALGVVDARGMRTAPQASLAVTAFGLAQAASGKVDDALGTLEEGLDPLRQPRAPQSWNSIHHLVATSKVAAIAGRVALARDLMDELTHRMARYPVGMEAMRVRAAAVQSLLSDEAATEMLGEPLTHREEEVLRLLQTDLTPQEIATELYLTLNTIKTHVSAVYRKLGAHSRSEAVVVARQRSLL